MLYVPTEYTHALQEVLSRNLSAEGLKGREGQQFIAKMARTVATLSQGLTRNRSEFSGSDYLHDPATRDAYLLYYTTTNLLKIWPPLREIAMSGFFENRQEIRHLDLGTGTGAAIWGLASYLKKEQSSVKRLMSEATDSLSQNLRMVESLCARFRSRIVPLNLAIRPSHLDLSVLSDLSVRSVESGNSKYDLITLMNVLNEVDETHDAGIIAMLQSRLAVGGAIVMIEPASRQESRRALRFRDRMVEAGWHVYAPCCKTGGCPALIDEDNWCHTEVAWERPPFIKAIDDEVGTLRLSLKSTYAVFLREDVNMANYINRSARDRRSFDSVNLSPPGRTQVDSAQDDMTRNGQDDIARYSQFLNTGRVVSERFDEKGRVRAFICNEHGRREYVMNKRDRSDANKAMLRTERYDLVQIEGVEVRGHDVKIGRDSVFHRLSGADGCGFVDNFE